MIPTTDDINVCDVADTEVDGELMSRHAQATEVMRSRSVTATMCTGIVQVAVDRYVPVAL